MRAAARWCLAGACPQRWTRRSRAGRESYPGTARLTPGEVRGTVAEVHSISYTKLVNASIGYGNGFHGGVKDRPLFASFPEDQLRMLAMLVMRKSAPRSRTIWRAETPPIRSISWSPAG